jgi:hypothetical protein
VQGIAECWFSFIVERESRGGVTEQNRDALVLEWLSNYNSLTSLECNLVQKVESRGGVERMEVVTRAKLARWLDDMLGHDERWRPNAHDLGDKRQQDGDEDTRLINALLALMWPLRQQLRRAGNKDK